MALSDDERRRLEALEEQLRVEDPRLARDLGNRKPPAPVPRRTVFAALAVLAGLAIVIVGVATQIPVIGVIGFALECAGAFWLAGCKWPAP
jgi:ferric-dicitrate binding protein FerR (iron transport regulator)